MSVVSNLTRQVIDNILVEVKKDENMAKIRENIIDPIIHYSIDRIYPYIIITGALFILTLLVAIIILIILIKK
jgi:hypothetical protein